MNSPLHSDLVAKIWRAHLPLHAERIRRLPAPGVRTGTRPPIVTLSGSTRFHRTFQEINRILTVGHILVHTIGCDTKTDGDLASAEDADEVKRSLDKLHLWKIRMSDEVLVLNVDGYIGESTRNEIDFAEQLGLPVRYLEPHSRRLSA